MGPIGPSRPGYIQGTADTKLNAFGVSALDRGDNRDWSPAASQTILHNMPYANLPAQGQVLGASTGPIGGGTPRIPSNNAVIAPSQPSQPSAPGVSQSDIDAIYNPESAFLTNLSGTLGTDRDAQLAGAQQKATSQGGVVEGQAQSLLDTLGVNKNQWNTQTQSAYGDALNNYNALSQRNSALYGGQSSAGAATNDLLNQEYLRTRTGIGNQDQSAQLTFNTENQDIANWKTDQHAKLDGWLTDAQQQIKNTFQQGINAINSDQAQTESAKAAAKLGLLQTVFQHQQALQDYDTQIRRQVELASATLPQGSFNPQQYYSTLNQLGVGLVQMPGQMTQNTQINGGAAPGNNFASTFAPTPNRNDQFSQLTNPVG